MANDSSFRRLTFWGFLLGAILLAFDRGSGASALREIRGTVRVGAQSVRGAEVTIIDAKEAASRYESCLNAAKSNLAVLSEKLGKLTDRKEAIEKDRSAKVYKTLFSETGPAAKEELRQEIDVLNAALTSINSEVAGLRGRALTWKSPDVFFEGRWTNVLGVARTKGNGEFVVRIATDRDCWLAIPGKAQDTSAPTPGWLIPVPANDAPLSLCETNAISIGS